MYELIESGNYLLDSDYAELSEGYYVTLSEYSADGYENDTTWLTNMINEGYLYIYTLNSDGELEQTSVATNTGLREVSDETNLKKAEAQYEADMLKIDKKERRYDTDLAAVENERDAISSEIDTLETVASDNVERTFKLFS